MHVDSWRDLSTSSVGRLGLILVSLVALSALLAPIIAPCSPTEMEEIFSPPSWEHLLGTDDLGRDVLSRLLYGARTSLQVSCGVSLLSTALSLLIGGTSALFGGIYDRIWMRIVDAMIAIPAVILMILAAAYLRPSLPLLIVLISAFSWPGGARMLRAQTLSLKERMHISAARTFGANWKHLLQNHIVPDLSPLLVAIMIQDARRAVFMEAGLAFLGVSDPMMISWGKMMHQAMEFTYLEVWKWWLLPAGLALSFTLVGLTFLGFGMETTMDPRLERKEC